jgi:hypothetical protein
MAARRSSCPIPSYSTDGGVGFTLYPSGQWSFFATVVDGSATFQTNTQGLVTKLVWTQSGQSLPYNKITMPARLSIHRDAGETQLTFTGDTGVNYVVEAANDLIHWIPIATNTIWRSREPLGFIACAASDPGGR